MQTRVLAAFLISLLAAPMALADGLAARVEGGWRLSFAAGKSELTDQARQALAAIAASLAQTTTGRITVEGQASGPADDASLARRLSLDRARAVRAALVAAGLDFTRIDVRALGRLEPPADQAEILPPGATRTTR